ncbi:hypothetical protein GQ457_06G006110 [Hibiscus cannabinus]
MSMLDIYDMIKELRYVVPHEIFWQEPGDRLKVNLLTTDNDVLTMLDSMPRNKYVHVYIQEVVEPIAEANLETGIEQNIFTRIDEETEQNIPVGIDDETDQNIETEIVGETEHNYEIGEDHYSVNVEEDSEGSEYVASDSEIEDSDNDLTDDELCDVDVEIGKDLPGFTVGLTVENEDDECDSKDSDSLHSADDSVADDRRRRYHEFNSEVDLENPQFRKGLVFVDQKIIKAAVREYGVRNRYNVRLKVNDSKRLQAVCKDGCPWMLWASRVSPKDSTNTSWQIKTYVGEHNCIRDVKNRNCTYRWVAKAYVDKFRVEPTYSTKSLRQDVATDHILQVPSSKCSRAKKLALEMIQGSHDEQYSRVYDYFAELGGCNPGTTTILQLDDRVFERMYICLQACKDGFKACKPIICLDGCFLKGHYQGWLLSAVGVDANDCVYPLAYAIVESENRSSWTWFLQILETDMELTNSNHYTFLNHGTNETVIPPIIRRPVGRPKKNRKKEADEALTATGRLGKTGVQMTCSKCGKTGHNKRSCKGQVGGNVPTSNGPRTKAAPTSNAPRRNIDPIPSVRRPQTSNIQGPTQPTQTEGSQNTQGSIMTARCMNSQPTQSSVNQTQSNTEGALSKRPRWK